MSLMLSDDIILHRKRNLNVQALDKKVDETSPQCQHMAVVKVTVSQCALHLGRVRMTYLPVREPGMSMDGSGQHQHIQANTKQDSHAMQTVVSSAQE